MSDISAQRALVILKHMADSPNGVSIREVGRALGYSPSAVQRSIQALVEQGFAVQDSVTENYLLGLTALQIGLAGLRKLQVRQVAQPYLEKLAQASGETALLGIRQGDQLIYIDKVVSPNEIRLDPPIGAARPFNCTAIGKAMLAYMPVSEIKRLAKAGAFVENTSSSITDLNALGEELARVREKQVAIDREEYGQGVMCLAAPVWNHNGAVVAAITISGPAPRMLPKEKDLIQQISECAKSISAALGYRG